MNDFDVQVLHALTACPLALLRVGVTVSRRRSSAVLCLEHLVRAILLLLTLQCARCAQYNVKLQNLSMPRLTDARNFGIVVRLTRVGLQSSAGQMPKTVRVSRPARCGFAGQRVPRDQEQFPEAGTPDRQRSLVSSGEPGLALHSPAEVSCRGMAGRSRRRRFWRRSTIFTRSAWRTRSKSGYSRFPLCRASTCPPGCCWR